MQRKGGSDLQGAAVRGGDQAEGGAVCQPPVWAARVGVWRGTQRALNACWGSRGGCRGNRQPQESDLGVTNWSPGWVMAPPGGVSLASPTPPRLRSLLLRCLPQARGRTWTPSPAHSVGAHGPSVLGGEAHTARGFPAGAERNKPQAGSRQEHGFPSHQGRGSRRHRGLGGPRELAPARGQRAVSVLPEARRESLPGPVPPLTRLFLRPRTNGGLIVWDTWTPLLGGVRTSGQAPLANTSHSGQKEVTEEGL